MKIHCVLWKQLNFKIPRHCDVTPDRSTKAPKSSAKMGLRGDTAELATGDNDMLLGNNPPECLATFLAMFLPRVLWKED